MFIIYIIFFALISFRKCSEIMAPTISKIAEIPNLQLGEGPHWDVETQSLFFVDILGNSIHKYTPSTKEHFQARFEKSVSLIIPVKEEENKYVISLEREIAVITWDGKSEIVSNIETIVQVDNDTANTIDDGKCDSSGRLLFGTMGPFINGEIQGEKSSLFSLVKPNKLDTLLTKIGISNGLTWNTALKKFYYIDSFSYAVKEFDYNIDNGTISNGSIIYSFPKPEVTGNSLMIPDGMTIDEDGNLWVAYFGGSKVLKIDPKNPETLLETIEIPTKQVTSVAWGGANLDILYVTSANVNFDTLNDLNEQEVVPQNEWDGAVFEITGLGTKGVPADNCNL